MGSGVCEEKRTEGKGQKLGGMRGRELETGKNIKRVT